MHAALTTRWIRTAAPVLVSLAVLAACDSAGASGTHARGGTSSVYNQKLDWAQCRDDPATQANESPFQCAKLRVPLDYDKPGGDTIELAVIRQPATDRTHRAGSLVVNPGGPGDSGIDMLASGHAMFDGAIAQHYDIVSFDPRGVGASAPVTCLSDQQQDQVNAEDLPTDPQAAHVRTEQLDKQMADACEARSGRLLPFVGTRNTARDLDVMRAVLGDEKLNYLGFSYGTYLGTLYAEQYPTRTGRMVLDGVVDPSADQLDAFVGQQVGFEASLEKFARDCVTQADCPLGDDPDKAATVAADFLDGLREHPLHTTDGRVLTSSLGWTGVIQMLYLDEAQSWPTLRRVLGMAMQDGNGDGLLHLADFYYGRDEQGHYTNTQAAFTAIQCADGAEEAPSQQRIAQVLQELHARAPLFSRDISAEDLSGAGCESWPFHSTEKPHPVRAEGSGPILVIGTTGDPATPYASAQKVASELANATLLTLVGEGHTAFGGKSACVDGAVAAYLVDGTMPAKGTRCQ